MAPSVDGDPNDTLLFNLKYLEDAHGIDLNLKADHYGCAIQLKINKIKMR